MRRGAEGDENQIDERDKGIDVGFSSFVDFKRIRRQFAAMAFNQGPLQLPDDPLAAFQLWMNEAVQAGVAEPTAMTLATASAGGRPAARIVLLKGVSDGGFSFFTNYESRKASDLDLNPFAALVFHWHALHRQVRIEGRVERVSSAESDEYFNSRPRGSQIGAWSSPQSREIEAREQLVAAVKKTEERFRDKNVTRPPFWGGYRVRPNRIEFWEEREYRLHERLVYEVTATEGWKKVRLAP